MAKRWYNKLKKRHLKVCRNRGRFHKSRGGKMVLIPYGNDLCWTISAVVKALKKKKTVTV